MAQTQGSTLARCTDYNTISLDHVVDDVDDNDDDEDDDIDNDDDDDE